MQEQYERIWLIFADAKHAIKHQHISPVRYYQQLFRDYKFSILARDAELWLDFYILKKTDFFYICRSASCGRGNDSSAIFFLPSSWEFLWLRWNGPGWSGFHPTNIFIISHSWHRRPCRNSTFTGVCFKLCPPKGVRNNTGRGLTDYEVCRTNDTTLFFQTGYCEVVCLACLQTWNTK